MQILAAIAALGEFVKLGKEIFNFIQGRIAAKKKSEVTKFIGEVTNEMGKLNKARNAKERKAAAQRVAAITARLF